MNDLTDHCKGLFVWADWITTIAGILAILAIAAAIWLLIVQAGVELRKIRKAAAKVPGAERLATQTAVDFFKALPEFINALREAPAPIALIALGLALLWLPDPEPGETCLKAYETQLKTETEIELAKAALAGFPNGEPDSISKVKNAKGVTTTYVWVQPPQPSK